MPKPNVESISRAGTDAVSKASAAVQTIVADNVEILTASGQASGAAFRELSKAYQEMATRNASNLTAAIQALAAVKSPTELIEIQQKLITDGVHAAVADGQNIATLTAAVFASAFAPVKKQIEAMQKSTPN